MSNDELTPAPIFGGGINTGSFEQPVVVTQMLGIGPAEPIREETLRARFLSFEPLFDSASRLAAYELVLRGRLAAAEGDDALAQMDEDMLLTGLYSLVQDGLTGELPLLVRVNPGVLFTDFPAQVNHPNLIWIVAVDSEAIFARMLALRDAGLHFCPILRGRDPHVVDSLDLWPHVMCSAALAPPAQAAATHFIIEGVAQAATLERWPEGTWFKGSLFTGETLTREEDQSLARRLDLLAVAMRQPLDTLINFFKLNPDMGQRLLDIANSPAGALSRPADSAGHALVMMGRQRAQRVAILLALANFVRIQWRPHSTELGEVAGIPGYHDLERHPEARLVEGLLIVRYDAPLFFANAPDFARRLAEMLTNAGRPIERVLVVGNPITDIDSTGAEVLTGVIDDLDRRDVAFAFAGLKGPVKDRLRSYGLYDRIGDENFYPNTISGVEAHLRGSGGPTSP